MLVVASFLIRGFQPKEMPSRNHLATSGEIWLSQQGRYCWRLVGRQARDAGKHIQHTARPFAAKPRVAQKVKVTG